MINELRVLLQDYKAVAVSCDQLEKSLKDLKNSKEQLSKQMAELMLENNVDRINIDGCLLMPNVEMFGNIKKENEREAYEWLKANGYDIGKIQVNADFRSQEEAAQFVLSNMDNAAVNSMDMRISSHWKTLSSAVKKLMEDGENIPEDLITVSQKIQTKVQEN